MPTPDLLVLHMLLFPDGALPANFPNLILWGATEQLTGVQTLALQLSKLVPYRAVLNC